MNNKKTVLLIEDESLLLSSYAQLLQDNGYDTLEAKDGSEGLNELKKNIGSIHLLILDLMLPEIDGLEILRVIKNDKEAYGSMPILVLTNMTSDRVIKEVFELDAVGYIVKAESSLEDLVLEVKKIFGEKV